MYLETQIPFNAEFVPKWAFYVLPLFPFDFEDYVTKPSFGDIFPICASFETTTVNRNNFLKDILADLGLIMP